MGPYPDILSIPPQQSASIFLFHLSPAVLLLLQFFVQPVRNVSSWRLPWTSSVLTVELHIFFSTAVHSQSRSLQAVTFQMAPMSMLFSRGRSINCVMLATKIACAALSNDLIPINVAVTVCAKVLLTATYGEKAVLIVHGKAQNA